MDYSKTLNLPVVDFHIYSESEIIDLWRKNQINSQLKQKNKSFDRYIIYEAPISTNSVDWNTLRAQISKDIFFKYKNMAESDVYWIAMWDVYNSSIERNALRELNAEKRKYDIIRLRRRCRRHLEDDLKVQTELLEGLGVFCDRQNIRKILNPRYDARIITVFGKLVEKSCLHKDLRPSYWCIKCQTILIDDDDMVNRTYQAYSGYVKFPVSIGLEEYGENVYMLVWVDTLWMLAASVAIVIREGGIYSIVKSGDEVLILEKGKEKLFNLDEMEVLNYISHSELAQCECAHPFLEYDLPVVSSKYVKDRVGIGLYNVAPGHNPLDYELALKHRFKTFSVVDAEGRLTNDADKFCGLEFIEAGKFIAFELEQRGYLMKKTSGGSVYPHCVSCNTPAIFRPISQWLLSSKNNSLRFHTLKELEELDWECNSAIKEKVMDTLEDMTNWCISCQREWGMPIPIILCNKCGQMIANQDSMKSIKDAIYRRSPDSWFRLDADELLPSDMKCPNCDLQEFIKEQGVLDPDFFSVISTLTRMPAKNRSTHTTVVFWGDTQHYSQYLALFFLTSFAHKSSFPFDKFHTYLFNEPPEGKLLLDILFDPVNLENYSSDFLRLCAVVITERSTKTVSLDRLERTANSLSSIQNDVNRSEIQKRIDDLKEEYELIVKMLYLTIGNLSDYDYDKDTLKYSSLINLDQISLVRLDQLIQDVMNAYDNCEFHTVWSLIFRYFQIDFSFYMDAIRDRIYASARSSVERLSAQTVLWQIANSLIKLIAPIFPFLAEQIWSIFSHRAKPSKSASESNNKEHHTEVWRNDEFNSIFLSLLPESNRHSFTSSSSLNNWTKLISLKKEIMREIDSALSQGIIDSKGQAIVTLPENVAREIEDYLKHLEIACSVADIVIEDCDEYAIARTGDTTEHRADGYNYA